MDFILILTIILIGYLFWKRAEKKHYDSILVREEQYKNIIILNDTDIQREKLFVQKGMFVSDGVAIALDAFKNFLAGIVSILWGRVRSYESLMDRARREAILRLKAKASLQGYNALVNLRLETMTIGGNQKKNGASAVETLAYATAVVIEDIWK